MKWNGQFGVRVVCQLGLQTMGNESAMAALLRSLMFTYLTNSVRVGICRGCVR